MFQFLISIQSLFELVEITAPPMTFVKNCPTNDFCQELHFLFFIENNGPTNVFLSIAAFPMTFLMKNNCPTNDFCQ